MAPLANDPIMLGTSIRSFRHLKHQNPSTGDDFIHSSGIIFLVKFLATKEALAPLVNVPIISGRSIRSFRHLEHQNPSIISGDIGRAKSKFSIFNQGCLVPFLATKEAVASLAIDPIMLGRSIRSFRHLEHQNLSIILDFIDSRRGVAKILEYSQGGWQEFRST